MIQSSHAKDPLYTNAAPDAHSSTSHRISDVPLCHERDIPKHSRVVPNSCIRAGERILLGRTADIRDDAKHDVFSDDLRQTSDENRRYLDCHDPTLEIITHNGGFANVPKKVARGGSFM